MVKRPAAVLAFVLLCLLQPCRSHCASLPSLLAAASPEDSQFTMEGKITDKSAGKLTLNSGDNMLMYVFYDDKTEIKKKDGSAGTVQDLHIGLTISVAGNLADSGEITAKKIEIRGDGSENKSAGGIPLR